MATRHVFQIECDECQSAVVYGNRGENARVVRRRAKQCGWYRLWHVEGRYVDVCAACIWRGSNLAANAHESSLLKLGRF